MKKLKWEAKKAKYSIELLVTAEVTNCVVNAEEDYCVALLGDGDDPEIEANAKLIAAAPELLEACLSVIDEKVSKTSGASPELSNTLRNKIDAAIKKATE